MKEKIKARFVFDLPREFIEYCIKHAPDEKTRKNLIELLKNADEKEVEKFSARIKLSD